MEAVLKAINDALVSKDTDITLKKWEIERLQKEVAELKNEIEKLGRENTKLRLEIMELNVDIEKYKENEVNRYE